jgi:glycosyltransferase involved in cell wall biosynthesis
MKKVSIIIITYNRPERLKIAINSALKQTYEETEIIVVDDNSNYDMSEISNNYNQKITFIKNKKNMGPSASRNVGIENSNGDFLTFLDDDDIFHPEKIEKQMDLFNKFENLGLVYCPVADIISNNLIYKPLKIENNKWVRVTYQNHIGITPLIRKECFHECGVFDNSLRYHEDRDLWYRIGKKYRFGFVKEPYYICYNFGEDRLSIDLEKIDYFKKLFYEKHIKDFNDQDLYFSDFYKEIALIYFFFGKYKKYFENIKKSVDKKPNFSSIFKEFYSKWLYHVFFSKTNIVYKKQKIDKQIKQLLKIKP